MSNSPETDAVATTHFPNSYGAAITFARKLERERDEARKLYDASLMREAAALEQLDEARMELAAAKEEMLRVAGLNARNVGDLKKAETSLARLRAVRVSADEIQLLENALMEYCDVPCDSPEVPTCRCQKIIERLHEELKEADHD